MIITNTPLIIEDLPVPSSGKLGWPWTESSNPLPKQMPDGSEWPKISIVTPSYNQEQFIEETIRSVLLQGYPNLEYIIIDGGSTDGSVEIIQKYESYLTSWVSEGDNGQSHAINKGFARSSGDILCWINSDDILKPGTLELVAINLKDTSIASWLVGCSELIDSEGLLIDTRTPGNITRERMLSWMKNWFPQQSTFWTRAMWEAAGPLDENLHYAMDYALWLNMFECTVPFTSKKVLSTYRFHKDAKCGTNLYKACEESIFVLEEYVKYNLNAKGLKLAVEKNIAEVVIQCANQYFDNREYAQAREFLKSAIRLHPFIKKDIVELVFNYADDCLWHHNYTHAREWIAFAIQVYPLSLMDKRGIRVLIKLIIGERGTMVVSSIKNFHATQKVR